MRNVLQILGMIFYPLIVHLLIALEVPWLAVAGLVVTSIIYLFLLSGLRRGGRTHPGWAMLYLLLTGLGILNLLSGTHYALYVPPVVINLALAVFFGATLRAGSTPLIEQMMHFEYQGLAPPPPLQSYARRLTEIWVAYFVGVAVVSVILAYSAPLVIWSLFTNILNYVFAIALLFGQYLHRLLRYRVYGTFMPWDTLRLMARQPWPGRAAGINPGRDPK